MRKITIVIVCMMLIPTFSCIFPIKISIGGDPNPGDIKLYFIIPKKGYLYFWDRSVGHSIFITTLIIGPITVEVYAVDNATGISRVEFYLDDNLVGNDGTGVNNTYSWIWDERGAFFPYVLGAKAYDLMGNSASIQMRVWKIL